MYELPASYEKHKRALKSVPVFLNNKLMLDFKYWE